MFNTDRFRKCFLTTFDHDGKFYSGVFNENFAFSIPNSKQYCVWEYRDWMKSLEPIILEIYAKGQPVEKMCPPDLMYRWNEARDMMAAHLNAVNQAGINLREVSLDKLVPQRVLEEYGFCKNIILQDVEEKVEKPSNYKLFVDVFQMFAQIRQQQLSLDFSRVDYFSISKTSRTFYKSLKKAPSFIDYDIFSSKTMRLTTRKDSFPFLRFDKELRSVLVPSNDLLIEFDYNAADIRTLLYLQGIEQPEGDVHLYNKSAFFPSLKREEVKQKFFSWLYNPKAKSDFDKIYDKKKLLSKFWDGKMVSTSWKESIEADAYHALNYLIQADSSYVFLKKAVEVWKYLNEHKLKTKIAGLIYDAILLDVAADEREHIHVLYEMCQNTEFGRYKVNFRYGKDYGLMRTIRDEAK